jgi:D-glycero-D-manno-heptose 1,7-bisphosphate phosphatase
MKVIILDRDGVINQDSDHYIKSAAEWQAIPGSLKAMAQLCQQGYTIFIASNQAGLARGLFSAADLQAINQKMCQQAEAAGAAISGIFYCPHHPDDHCHCRKPAIGLIQQIEQQLGHSVKGSYFIGDSLKDIIAAQRAECQPVLVQTGKGQRTLASHPQLADQIPVYPDLAAAVNVILSAAH